MAREFYAGLGLPVDDVLARSDLYERPNKNQHAYCMDVDREGEVRVLANVRDDERWAGTMLHELGHAVYSKHHDRALPFLLRDAAHMFTTEAVAMMMGRLTADADWLERVAGVEAGRARSHVPASRLRLGELIFVRWALVVVSFERELYRDPAQDLDALWWRLASRYQEVTPPEGRRAPDYASKIHLGTAPVYYQNYLLGTLAASQFRAALPAGAGGGGGGGLVGNRAAGVFLRERIFRPGALYPWGQLMRRVTGSPLGPEAFLHDFAG